MLRITLPRTYSFWKLTGVNIGMPLLTTISETMFAFLIVSDFIFLLGNACYVTMSGTLGQLTLSQSCSNLDTCKNECKTATDSNLNCWAVNCNTSSCIMVFSSNSNRLQYTDNLIASNTWSFYIREDPCASSDCYDAALLGQIKITISHFQFSVSSGTCESKCDSQMLQSMNCWGMNIINDKCTLLFVSDPDFYTYSVNMAMDPSATLKIRKISGCDSSTTVTTLATASESTSTGTSREYDETSSATASTTVTTLATASESTSTGTSREYDDTSSATASTTVTTLATASESTSTGTSREYDDTSSATASTTVTTLATASESTSTGTSREYDDTSSATASTTVTTLATASESTSTGTSREYDETSSATASTTVTTLATASESTSTGTSREYDETSSATDQTTNNQRNSTTTQNCACSCELAYRLNNQSPYYNMTTEQRGSYLQEQIRQIQEELTVETSNLSATIRKKTSANDNRTSAKVMGFTLGVSLICLVLGLIIAMDLPNLIDSVRRIVNRSFRKS